jgi:hypothetical protein
VTRSEPAFYAQHTATSDPGRHAALFDCIAPDLRTLPNLISNLVVHPGLASARGITLGPHQQRDRHSRKVEVLLDRLIERDRSPLQEARSIECAFAGTCRDYAMLGIAILRHHGVPARLRGGFACYFFDGKPEDHWVAEVWRDEAWHLVDFELGDEALTAFKVSFDPQDVPRDAFITSPEAWLGARRGELDPDEMGVSMIGATGQWFAAASIARDAAAIAGIELLPWEYWNETNAYAAAPEALQHRLGDLDRL